MHQLRTSRYRGFFVERLPEGLAKTWIAQPRALVEENRPSRAGLRSRPVTIDSPWGAVVVKHHWRGAARGVLDALVLRPSPALRAFRLGLRLETRGVDAARPLAAIESVLPGESFLFLEKLEACDLRDYLLAKLGALTETEARRRFKSSLWQVLGEAVAMLHSAPCRQRDLKAPNILISDTPDRKPRVTFVDLEGMRHLRRLPACSIRARDLGRLAVSLQATAVEQAGIEPADWEEVIRCYLEAARASDRSLEATPAAWWIETTLSWAGRKAARNRRKGRPIY